MGKTAGNSVWLDADLTSPFDFYQYWVNVDDRDVERLLNLYTFLPDERIAELTGVGGAALREAKHVLAFEVTAAADGRDAADAAAGAARALFGSDAPDPRDDPSVPTLEVSRAEVAAGLGLADLFVRSGLCTSRGDARRQAAQGALSLDDARVDDVDAPFAPASDIVMLRFGKKKHRRVRVS